MTTHRDLIDKWNDTLSAVLQELHTSRSPIHSEKLQTHYHNLGSMHLDISNVQPIFAQRIRTYINILEESLCHLLNNDRAKSMALVRHLQYEWLPDFTQELDRS